MIDINELRRLAQEAMHPVTKGRWMRLFGERTVYDRMEDGCRGIPVVSTPVSPPFPFEAACLDFIAAANPAVTIELLDRLEAAEKDITIKEEVIDSLDVVVKRLDAQCDAAEAEAIEQSRLNGMGSEREAALMAKLEAAEKERDECNRRRLEAADHFAAQTALMKKKYDTLRAKIAEMERQAPAYWGPKHAIEGGSTTVIVSKFPVNPTDAPLYALPGAQIAPSIHEGVRKVTLGFRWESEAQHHIPTIEIEFDPVSPDSPNDAKGWQDRDRIASMLSPEAKP